MFLKRTFASLTAAIGGFPIVLRPAACEYIILLTPLFSRHLKTKTQKNPQKNLKNA